MKEKIKINRFGHVQKPYPEAMARAIEENKTLLDGKEGTFQVSYTPYPGEIRLEINYRYAGVEKTNISFPVWESEIERTQ